MTRLPSLHCCGLNRGSVIAFLLLASLSLASACNDDSCSISILPTNNPIVAVARGDWHQTSTWDLGRVPQPGDNVVIPEGIRVRYNGTVMDADSAPIRSIRVDGELWFVPWWNNRLVVDTILVTETGTFRIGEAHRPVYKWTEIIFAGGNLNLGLDPNLKGRGLMSHGNVEIYGEVRTPFVELASGANAISADGKTITLASAPVKWRRHDELLITGDERTGKSHGVSYTLDSYTTRDEVREIENISGNVVTLKEPLTPGFHDRPFPGMPILVANLDKNVRFMTAEANADVIHRRGHAMFMQSPNVVISGAAFINMGRSNKDEPLTDIGSSVTANMKGRYPVHFHQIGQEQVTPVVIRECVVRNSPGWGIALHSSHGIIEDNVTFEVFASHIVAEEGDERGSIRRNLAVKSVGDTRGIKSHKTTDSDGTVIQDDGQRGHGFWFQSRNLAVEDNYAISHGDEGFVYFHRNIQQAKIPVDLLLTEHRDILAAQGYEELNRDDTPIVVANRNVAVGCSKALHVIKANREQGHDIRNMFVGWRGYEVSTGTEVQYTGEYTFRDFEMYNAGTSSKYAAAYLHGNQVIDMVHVNFVADGWARTFISSETFPNAQADDVGNLLFVAGQVRQNGETNFAPFDLATHCWKDEHEANNGGTRWYVPSVHTKVAYNSKMDLDSSYLLPAPVMDQPLQVAGQGVPAADWPKVKFTATGIKTDSAGAAPRDPQWEDTFSFSRYWGGQLRSIITDESYWVGGKQYIDLVDHAGDRVSGRVRAFSYPVEVTPY